MWISPRRHVTRREYNRRDRVAYRPHDPSRSMRTSMSRHILSSRRLSLELATFSAEDVSNHRPAPRKPHQDHQQQREEALLHPIHQPSTRTPRPPRSGGLRLIFGKISTDVARLGILLKDRPLAASLRMRAWPIHVVDRQAGGFQDGASDHAAAGYSRPSGVRRSIHSSASARVMSLSGLPRRFSRRSTPFSPRHSTASVFRRSTWLLRALPASLLEEAGFSACPFGVSCSAAALWEEP